MARIDLQGKPIAITGASSGIGRATALACARAGMPVVVAARRVDRLREVVDVIRAGGGRALAVECDVTDAGQCSRVIEETVREFGSIYSVFANAGYGFEKPLDQTSDAEIHAIIETNFFGTLNTVRPAIERFKRTGSGHVLICSSCLAKMGIPCLAPYSATKAMQDHFGRAMRAELRPAGIHVSTVHPIGTKTEFFDTSGKTGGMASRTPDSFMQPPERVADAVVACLRKPQGEVWTSTMARLAFGAATMFPGIADAMLARKFARPKRQG